jgi:hypothetical protein
VISDLSIVAIAFNLPHLKVLKMGGCDITNLRPIAEHCKELTKLNISKSLLQIVTNWSSDNIKNINPPDLIAIAENGNLTHLYAQYHCAAITDESILAIANLLPNLKALDIVHYLPGVEEHTIRTLLNKCLFLESFIPPHKFTNVLAADLVRLCNG